MRLAIYTVAADWNGNLPRAVVAKGVENICFFSGKAPFGPGWKFRAIEAGDEFDLSRRSRLPKAMPHLFLRDFDYSIYIDATVQLNERVVELVRAFARDRKVIGLVQLEARKNLAEEFKIVGSKRFDTGYTLGEQLHSYSEMFPAVLKGPVFWGGMIVRQHLSPHVVSFGERWWWNILRYSRRDQLSLPVALIEIPRFNMMKIDGSESVSSWHSRLPGVTKKINYTVGPPIRLRGLGNRSGDRAFMLAEIVSLRTFLRLTLRLLRTLKIGS